MPAALAFTSASSTTYTGVPKRSASSVAGTPAIVSSPAESRDAFRDHTDAGSALASTGTASHDGASGLLDTSNNPTGAGFAAPVDPG